VADFRLSLTIEGQEVLDRSIARFSEDLADLRTMWPDVLKVFHEIEAEQFATQGHGSWQALSPAYAKEKERDFPGRPILVRTGRMRDAFTKGGWTRVVIANAHTLGILVDTDYWQAHQFGNQSHGLPQRKVVDLTSANVAAIMKVPQRYLVKAAKDAGLLRYGGTT